MSSLARVTSVKSETSVTHCYHLINDNLVTSPKSSRRLGFQLLHNVSRRACRSKQLPFQLSFYHFSSGTHWDQMHWRPPIHEYLWIGRRHWDICVRQSYSSQILYKYWDGCCYLTEMRGGREVVLWFASDSVFVKLKNIFKYWDGCYLTEMLGGRERLTTEASKSFSDLYLFEDAHCWHQFEDAQ